MGFLPACPESDSVERASSAATRTIRMCTPAACLGHPSLSTAGRKRETTMHAAPATVSDPDVLVPQRRVLGDEGPHHLDAPRILEHLEGDTAAAQQRLLAHERHVF